MKKVLITRQIEQSTEMINLVSKRGYLPYSMPLIETKAIPYSGDNINADIIIFSSENAVKFYTPLADTIKADRFIAVGEKTALKFSTLFNSRKIDIPKNYDMKSIVDELKTDELDGKTIVILSAREHTEADLTPLQKVGTTLRRIALYETDFVLYNDFGLDKFIIENGIGVVTFCSPSAVKSYLKQSQLPLQNYEVVAIGKTTADYLEKNNINSRYPTKYTIEAMVDII